MSYWRHNRSSIALALVTLAFCIYLPSLQAASDSSAEEAVTPGQYIVSTANLPFEPARVGLNLQWTQRLPAKENQATITDIYGLPELLLVQTFNANLIAFNADSGTWHGGISMNAQVSQPPIRWKRWVLAICQTNLLMLNMDESELKVERRVGIVPSAPFVTHKNRVIVPTESAEVVAIDVRSGKREWSFKPGGAVRGGLVLDKNTVYAAAYKGGIVAADVDTGSVKWSWEPSNSSLAASNPAAENGFVFVGDTHGFVHCLSKDIGLPQWKYPTGSPVEECISLPAKKLLVTTHRGDTLCLSSRRSPEESRLLWTISGSHTFLTHGQKRLYLLSEKDHSLLAVSMEDGKEIWRRKLPEDIKLKAGAKKGSLYLYTESGEVIALSEAK